MMLDSNYLKTSSALKKNIVNFNKYLVEYLPTKYLLNIKIYLFDTRNVNLI